MSRSEDPGINVGFFGHSIDLDPPICPKCGSRNIVRNGHRDPPYESVQRYLCKDCEYRFSDVLDLDPWETSNSSIQGTQTRTKKESANMTTTVTECVTEKPVTVISPKLDRTIIQYTNHLLKEGKAHATIEAKVRLLKTMIKRGADLDDPESVKLFIANQTTWSQGRKRNAVHAYTNYLDMIGKTWKAPSYQSIAKPIWIPQEIEVDQLIAGCSPRIAAFLQLLKETGMRPGEAYSLKWIDLDLPTKSVHITPEKGSNPRTLPLSDRALTMLHTLRTRNEYIFKTTLLKHFRDGFVKQRKKIAVKLQNPRIQRITFKTFRHFKGTMEYHKTKDILHVKRVLGHRNIKNTEVYTHLIDFPNKDDYIAKSVRTHEEALKLMEIGFDHEVTTPDGYMLFRKLK